MAKRFTDTDKWKKPFLRSMKAPYKLLWIYILDECDHAGIWQVDFDVAQIKIGEKLDKEIAINTFSDRILELSEGTKWFIFDFIEFQYGELNPSNRAHNSVIKILEKYSIDLKNKPLISPLQGAKDMVKDKDKRCFDFHFLNDQISEKYHAFLKMRKSIKKPFHSQEALEANYQNLIKISKGNTDIANEILQQSIGNEWQGLFELKGNTKQKTSMQSLGEAYLEGKKKLGIENE